jgi:hypothetical protein
MADRVMTEEERREMMGLLPFSREETIPFTPKCYDRFPEDFKPVFTLKPMDDKTKRQVLKSIKNIKNVEDEIFREYVRKHCVKWENYYDLGTKEKVVFEPAEDGGCKQDLFSSVPAKPCGQLLQYLCRISGLWTEAEKEGLES